MAFVFRPTKSLYQRMSGGALGPTDLVSTTRLGDWTAADIVLSRKQYVLCVCEASRLPVVLKAAPYHTVAERLPQALEQMLRFLKVPESIIADEVSAMTEVDYAKTVSRSILGSVKEFTHTLKWQDDLGRLDHSDLLAMSLWLADTISLVLKEGTPSRETLAVLGVLNREQPKLRLISGVGPNPIHETGSNYDNL